MKTGETIVQACDGNDADDTYTCTQWEDQLKTDESCCHITAGTISVQYICSSKDMPYALDAGNFTGCDTACSKGGATINGVTSKTFHGFVAILILGVAAIMGVSNPQ